MRAPAVFELSDIDGHATAISGEIPGREHDAVREAVGSCPEQAVSLN